MFRGYDDISKSKESQESGDELRRMVRDAHFAEEKRQREGDKRNVDAWLLLP